LPTYSVIFARGGSKGLPGKNIRPFAGVPLLAHTINLAHSIGEIDRVFVSTDDPEIAEVARNANATVIARPSDLAKDDSPEWLAWQHAVKWIKNKFGAFDRFVSLPATSPLRSQDDVSRCLLALNDRVDMVVAISESARSPWFNMVSRDEQGYVKTLCENKARISRRQDSPSAYDLTTVAYVSRPDFIKRADGVFAGRTKGIEVPRERAIDIDTILDFKIAEYIWFAKQERQERP
jgi:N,N'-diacetyl-8-epilegionaminate cytidylyltransferase